MFEGVEVVVMQAMRVPEFEKLLDELAACAKQRTTMAKAFFTPRPAARPTPVPSFKPLLRDIAQHEREMRPVYQAMRRDQFRAGIRKADAMLKALVIGGRITAVEAAKGEWHLNRLRDRL